MEAYHLKRRLIGAVVLVALGVIFIPMLLSVQTEKEIPVFGSNIPPRPVEMEKIEEKSYEHIAPVAIETPKIDRIPIDESLPEPAPPVTNEEKPEQAVTENKGNDSKPEQTEKTETAPASSVAVRAWAVQVGSFSNRGNATALRDSLKAKKYHAFVDRVNTARGPTYRVRVGPEVKKEQAEILKAKLEKEEQLKGLLVRHPQG